MVHVLVLVVCAVVLVSLPRSWGWVVNNLLTIMLTTLAGGIFAHYVMVTFG